MRSVVLLAFLLFTSFIRAEPFSFVDGDTSSIQAGTILRVDILAQNTSDKNRSVSVSVISPRGIERLTSDTLFSLPPNSQEVISFFFRVDQHILHGEHVIDFSFFYDGKGVLLKKKLIVEKITKAFVKPKNYYVEKGCIEYIVVNQSNHPISFEGKTVPPYSTLPISEKAPSGTNRIIRKKCTCTECDEVLFEQTLIFAREQKVRRSDKYYEFFPLDYGFAYSNANNRHGLTFFSDGAFKIGRETYVNYRLSAPFSSGSYSLAFFDPYAAVFYFHLRHRNAVARIGDSYYDYNSNLLALSARGYTLGVDSDAARITAGYITPNPFYPNQNKYAVLEAKSKDDHKLIYTSFYKVTKPEKNYSQHLGYEGKHSLGKWDNTAALHLYNTDFHLTKAQSGTSIHLLGKNPHIVLGANYKYLGNEYLGWQRAQQQVSGNFTFRSKERNIALRGQSSVSYFFPKNTFDTHYSTSLLQLSKQWERLYTSLAGEYYWYNNGFFKRENVIATLRFQKEFPQLHLFLSGAQGASFSNIFSEERFFKNYTQLQATLSLSGQRLYMGIVSQTRNFSNSARQENIFSLGGRFQFGHNALNTMVYLNNKYLQYNYGLNAGLKRKTRRYLLEATYQFQSRSSPNSSLQDSLNGNFAQQILFRLTVHNWLRFKKTKSIAARFIDAQTNKPLQEFAIHASGQEYMTSKKGIAKLKDIEYEDTLIDIGRHLNDPSLRSYYTIKKHDNGSIDFHVPVSGNITGKITIQAQVVRQSLDSLIKQQKVIARADDGKQYHGLINTDGSFTIYDLPTGRYVVAIDSKRLPLDVQTSQEEVVVQPNTSLDSLTLHIQY